jgi:hypothetical protein
MSGFIIPRREYSTHSLQAWVEMKGAVFRNHSLRSVVESPQYDRLCSGSLNRYGSRLCGSLKLELGRSAVESGR